jgi:hypothetical protein
LVTLVCIQLAVDKAEDAKFTTVLDSIQRLMRLAAKNAVAGSNVEIIAVPDPDASKTAKPAAAEED